VPKVTIKADSVCITEKMLDEMPVFWDAENKPSQSVLDNAWPNGRPKICVIPYKGWTPTILGRNFALAREQYGRRETPRIDYQVTIPEFKSITKTIWDGLERSVKNNALQAIGRSLELPSEMPESSPIVELVPWRDCQFVINSRAMECWLVFDGAFIVPIDTKVGDKERDAIVDALKMFYKHILKVNGLIAVKNQAKITIGLDPEMSVYRIVNGKAKIENHIHAGSTLGCRDTWGRVGTDGCDSIFEFRPQASTDISKVVDSVENCVKVLAFQLGRKGYRNAYALAGGGCNHSIGGHIHIGNDRLKRMTNSSLTQLGQMLDDFIYHPIRDRMPGGVRQWLNMPSQSQASFGGPIPHFNDLAEAKENMKDITRFNRGTRFSGYDAPGQWRQKNYGWEYRSLPSFIANRELTNCVLSMTQKIASFFYDLSSDGGEYTYNQPPKTEDYKTLFGPELTASFMRYINGDMRSIFLDNVFDSWGIRMECYHRPITIYRYHAERADDDDNELSEMITKKFYRLMRAYHGDRLKLEMPYFVSNSSNQNYAVLNSAGIARRIGGGRLAIPPDMISLTRGETASFVMGGGLSKNGKIHCVKQALILDAKRRQGSRTDSVYFKFCDIVRSFMPETEEEFGAIKISDFERTSD